MPSSPVVRDRNYLGHCMLTRVMRTRRLVFQVLRVYAISGRMWQFALVIGLFSIFPIVWSIVRGLFCPRSLITLLRYTCNA